MRPGGVQGKITRQRRGNAASLVQRDLDGQLFGEPALLRGVSGVDGDLDVAGAAEEDHRMPGRYVAIRATEPFHGRYCDEGGTLQPGHADAVASVRLGTVKRGIGGGDELLDGFTVAGPVGESLADGN